MYFTLLYSGELRSNAKPAHKHELRKAFHSQLAVLWQQPPLVNRHGWFDKSYKYVVDLNREVGDFRFVPLVSSDLCMVCELQITMLRLGPPGALITQGGDIDNRLKTLLDALRIPHNTAELPKGLTVGSDETPFFCLLEDDSLITDINVRTDRLLVPSTNKAEVHLVIRVKTRATQMGIAGKKKGDIQVTGGFILS